MPFLSSFTRARSRLPNGSVFREYVLALDDQVTKDEYLVVVKRSLRLIDSVPI